MAVLCEQLPPTGALGRSIDRLEVSTWGNLEELVATLIEVADLGNRNFVVANSKKGTPPPKPIKITRPNAPKPVKRKATSEDLAAMFGVSVRHVPTEEGQEQAD